MTPAHAKAERSRQRWRREALRARAKYSAALRLCDSMAHARYSWAVRAMRLLAMIESMARAGVASEADAKAARGVAKGER
jgi:hypothetical protein